MNNRKGYTCKKSNDFTLEHNRNDWMKGMLQCRLNSRLEQFGERLISAN